MTTVAAITLVVGIPVVFTVAGTYLLVIGGSALRWALAQHRRHRTESDAPRAVARIRRSVA